MPIGFKVLTVSVFETFGDINEGEKTILGLAFNGIIVLFASCVTLSIYEYIKVCIGKKKVDVFIFPYIFGLNSRVWHDLPTGNKNSYLLFRIMVERL